MQTPIPVKPYVAPAWTLKPPQLSPRARAFASLAAGISALVPKLKQARADLREVREARAAAARRSPEAIVRATREALGESSPYFRLVLDGEAHRLAASEHISHAAAVAKLTRAAR